MKNNRYKDDLRRLGNNSKIIIIMITVSVFLFLCGVLFELWCNKCNHVLSSIMFGVGASLIVGVILSYYEHKYSQGLQTVMLITNRMNNWLHIIDKMWKICDDLEPYSKAVKIPYQEYCIYIIEKADEFERLYLQLKKDTVLELVMGSDFVNRFSSFQNRFNNTKNSAHSVLDIEPNELAQYITTTSRSFREDMLSIKEMLNEIERTALDCEITIWKLEKNREAKN